MKKKNPMFYGHYARISSCKSNVQSPRSILLRLSSDALKTSNVRWNLERNIPVSHVTSACRQGNIGKLDLNIALH